MWQSGPPLGCEYPGEPGRNGETPARHHSSDYLPRMGPHKDSWLKELRAEGGRHSLMTFARWNAFSSPHRPDGPLRPLYSGTTRTTWTGPSGGASFASAKMHT
jgi:hypothetical protein